MVFLIFIFLVWTNFQNYKSLFIKIMNHDLWSEDDELELKKVGLVLNDWTLGHKVYFLKFISVFQSPALGHCTKHRKGITYTMLHVLALDRVYLLILGNETEQHFLLSRLIIWSYETVTVEQDVLCSMTGVMIHI